MTTHVTEAGFDRFADEYEAYCDRGLALAGESKEHFARERLAWLSKWLAAHCAGAPGQIIDFGCGIGDVTTLIAARFPSAVVTGLDISRGCVKRARRERSRPGVRFEPVDDYASSDREPADLLHCNGVIHHVPPPDRPAVVAKMVSLVRPGGFICLFENNPWNPGTHWVMRRIPFDRDAKMITPAHARRLLRRCGAEVRETAFLFFFPRALRALRVIEPFLLHVPCGAQYGVICEIPARDHV